MTELPTTSGRDDLMFHVRRAIRYHMLRVQHYQRAVLTLRLTLFLGAWSAWLCILTGVGMWWPVGLLTVVIVAVLTEATWRPYEHEYVHRGLVHEHTDQERALLGLSETDREALVGVHQAILDIERRSPHIRQVALRVAHNELVRALGQPESQYVTVSWWQRLWNG